MSPFKFAESLTTPLPEKITRKRGRPKQKELGPPLEKLMDKIINATKSSIGSPAVYASTTKGGMKLIYEGHHFRYSFRRGEHSVFQCCYKENKEECKVRVVSDQKRVFPLDGEHVHFIQATDKSVTSCHFETADSSDVIAAMKIQLEVAQTANETKEQPPPVIIDNELIVEAEAEPEYYGEEVDITQSSDTVDANDFREKIKKRLQKALLGKKK